MSGAKNFGVRSPADPAAIHRHRPDPPPPVEPEPEPAAPPPDGAGGGATCCCRCRCSCAAPDKVALPAVAPSVPPQLLTPFPEPPALRRPVPSGTASLLRSAGTADPGALQAPVSGPGPVQLPANDPAPRRAPSETAPHQATGPPDQVTGPPDQATGRGQFDVMADGPSHRPGPTADPGSSPVPAYPRSKHQPAAAMFQGGEEDDHPYVRILETPAPERPLLARYLQPISWGGIGFGSAFVFNLFAKKPPFAGIQRHLALGAAGWVAGLYINKWIESNSAERDAVLKHYIQLHPEDFPVPERKKFGEILQPWSPLR